MAIKRQSSTKLSQSCSSLPTPVAATSNSLSLSIYPIFLNKKLILLFLDLPHVTFWLPTPEVLRHRHMKTHNACPPHFSSQIFKKIQSTRIKLPFTIQLTTQSYSRYNYESRSFLQDQVSLTKTYKVYLDYALFLDELLFSLNLITDLLSNFFLFAEFPGNSFTQIFYPCSLDPMPFKNSLHFSRAR